MPVTDVRKDLDRLTMTMTARLDADPDRAWQLWADPRQLERWWGPPSHPATVDHHDLTPGGRVGYHMTGPDGEQYPGMWTVLEVEAPHRLLVEDLFADEDGNPAADMPTSRMEVTIEPHADGGSTMSITSTFATREAMEQVLAMGAEEGMGQAMGQIDAILREDAVR
jgi:uncharacterized protein YndB with AHSA1/START domain